MNKLLKYSLWIFILSTCLGFRLLTKAKWPISKDDPTIWVKVCQTDFTVGENDITEGDPLAGVAGITLDQIIQSVIDDYNNVPTSYLRLAKYPTDPENPGPPLTGDSTFTIEKAKERTIEICFGATDARVTSGGYSKPQVVGGKLVGCEIRAKESFLSKAAQLTHLIAHESGHCMALAHPQEGTRSLMSYFTTEMAKKMRLQDDDKAGLTYLYPEDSSYAQENATFGLSGCEPKNN